MRLEVELSGPQMEMYQMAERRIRYPLFLAGYSAGKSHILVHNVVRDVLSFEGCKVAVYAPTHDLLSLNLVPRVEAWLDVLGLAHDYNASKHIMQVSGGMIIFRSMDNPKRIVAYEVYRSHVDEADLMHTPARGWEAWDRVLGRNRQKHPDKKQHFGMVSAYSTPEGHAFTYQRWQKKKTQNYVYVQATTESNKHNPQDYIDGLKESYTPEQQKAYLYGEWTNLYSGNVYPYYNRSRCRTARVIMPGDKLMIGADFNYGGSCCATYVPLMLSDVMQRDESVLEAEKKKVEADPWLSWDKYERQAHTVQVGLQLVDEFATTDTEEMKDEVLSRYKGHKVIMYPDATGVKNTTNASASDIAILGGAGLPIAAHSTNPRIKDRVNAVNRMLHSGLMLVNDETAPESAAALEEHAYQQRLGVPEKHHKPASIDDRNDATGYPVAYMYPIKDNVSLTSVEF